MKYICFIALFFSSLFTSQNYLQYDPSYDEVNVSLNILDDKYDRKFQKYWELWNPPTTIYKGWMQLKSQCYAESSFNPNAISPVGAQGLCQFMPGTWAEYGVGNPFDADASINASAKYMSALISGWKSERPDEDRLKLAQASYNAGFGNLLKAQKKCDNKSLYDEIIQCLPKITGHHSIETKVYIKEFGKVIIF